MKTWFLYLIRCKDRSLYTGITTNVKRRLEEHQNDERKAAKYLRGKSPLALVWQAKIGDKSTALKMENKVKRLSKVTKEKLVDGKINIGDIN